MAEVQKQEAISGSKVQLNKLKSNGNTTYANCCSNRKQKMQCNIQFDMQLKQMDMQAMAKKARN